MLHPTLTALSLGISQAHHHQIHLHIDLVIRYSPLGICQLIDDESLLLPERSHLSLRLGCHHHLTHTWD